MEQRIIEITEDLRGKKYFFRSKPGVFSKNEVDRGSKLLIETMKIEPQDEILDLGCGYGPIGIVAADLAYKGKTTLIDANIRAVRLAEENIKLNNLNNAKALLSDGLEIVGNQQFDIILSNPPFSAGVDIFEEFAKDSFKTLKTDGKIYFVTQSKLKDPVKRIFLEYYGNFEIAGRNNKYVVSLAIKT